nr:hypothetical protein CFP56_05991 [Quercus suber]
MKGKTFKGKALQKGKMDASSEKVLMQKMLECVAAQAKVLKKIIGHLSEIAKEEAEKDKANHEQSELTQPHDGRKEGPPIITQLYSTTKECP